MEGSFNNSNMTDFSQEAAYVESYESKIAKTVAISLVGFIAVVGNCLVIAAVFQNSKIQTVTNYLIVNMAVADLLYIAILLPPFYLEIFQLYELTLNSHISRVYFCTVVHVSQYFFLTVSVLTLATIAVDRFLAIALPLRKIFTKPVFYIATSAIWLIGAAVASPQIYANKIVYDKDENYYYCDEDWGPAFKDTTLASRVYTSLLFSVVYCIPFLAMSIMYTIICKKLWKRKIPGEQSAKTCKALNESRKKVVKMLIVVLIAFIICWLPIQIQSFIWEYTTTIQIPPVVGFATKFLMRAHPAMSPCIYAIFSANYRAGFKKALCYCCVKKKDFVINNESCSRRATSYIMDPRKPNGRKNTLLIIKAREKALAKYDD